MAGKEVTLASSDESPPARLIQTQVIGLDSVGNSIPVLAATSGLSDTTLKLPSMLTGSGLSPAPTREISANNGSNNKKARSAMELKVARESRANEALKMKDDQLRILTDQNSQVRSV